jgi:hypothetical protein
VQASEVFEGEGLFVTWAGVEWERWANPHEMGGARSDVEDAKFSPYHDKPAIEAITRQFIHDHARLITAVGLAIIVLAKRDGHLGEANLKKLVKWTRGHVVTPKGLKD